MEEINFDAIELNKVPMEACLLKDTKSITKQIVTLENGAEAYFLKLSDEQLSLTNAANEEGRYPMITLIHGGPFSSSPGDMFLL